MRRRSTALWRRLLMLALLPILTASCLPFPTAAAESRPVTIRVGFFAFDGYHEIDENGNRSGYGYDFLTLMRRYANVNYEYVGYDRSWSDMQQLLLDGEIDMVTSAHRTPEREALFDFSLPIGTNSIHLNVRADETRYISGDYAGYDGMRVGMLTGSSSNDRFAEFALEKGFTWSAVYYPDSDALEAALAAGEIDAAVASSLRRIRNETILDEFNTEYFYVIVRKGDTALLEQIDRAIRQMDSNEGDWKNSLYYSNYLAENYAELHFTADEQAYIAAHSGGSDRVVLAVDTNWCPFSWKANGGYTGILPDMIASAMAECGMDYVLYDAAEITNADVLADAQVDMYLGYCLNDDVAAGSGLVASDTILECGSAYLLRKETTQLHSLAVCATTPYLNSMLPPDTQLALMEYPNTAAAEAAVLAGAVDAAYLYDLDAQYTANHDLTGSLAYRLNGGSTIRVRAVMRADDDRTLMGIWLKCFRRLSASKKSAIVSDYVSHTATSLTLRDYVLRYPFLFIGVGLLLLGLLTAIVVIRLKQRTDARHRTELEEKLEEISALNSELEENQARLEESAAEQEAQLEEITALNSELEENQARLEESVAEQEAQLEEISALNAELETASTQRETQLDEIERLNRSFRESLDIIANAGFGIWRITMRTDGRHTMEADRTLQRIFGITELGLSPEALYTYYHGRLRQDVGEIEHDDYAQMSGGRLMTRILEWEHPTKGLIILSAGGTCYRETDEGMMISGYCGDITAQRRELEELNRRLEAAAKQADAANRSKSDFLFSMSHDIRTPMNAIIGYANLMKKAQDDQERCADYLEKIIASGDFLLELINDVLEMARVESGKTVLDETPWSTTAFNDSLFAVFAEGMRRKDIRFTRSVDIRHEYLFCDSVKLREIFLNLLSNAMKYTPNGGSVHMELKELPSDREDYALLQTTISDTGIGMSEQFLPHLFEAFSRETTATENKIQGTGLGMPIVKKLVDLMGGSIDVTSELGRGTTFVVRLYHRIAPAEALQGAAAPSEVTCDLTGKHILLAEDNDLNAEIAIELLSETGAQIDRAEDGIVCFDMLRRAEPGYYDAILMDIQMPNLNGYRATEKIRRAGFTLPIIAMTANAFDEDKRNALAAGMNAHIAKPIDVPQLMQTLAALLGG